MLLLVLILVLVAFGLLVVALLTGNVLCAWLSVVVSVAAAVVLIVDWRQRRSAEKAGRAGVETVAPPARVPAAHDPVTEVLPVVAAGGDTGGSQTMAVDDRLEADADTQRTVMMPAVQPSGSVGRPSGAEASTTSSGGSLPPRVTTPPTDSSSGDGARETGDEPRTADRGDAEATVVVDIRKRPAGAGAADAAREDVRADRPRLEKGAPTAVPDATAPADRKVPAGLAAAEPGAAAAEEPATVSTAGVSSPAKPHEGGVRAEPDGSATPQAVPGAQAATVEASRNSRDQTNGEPGRHESGGTPADDGQATVVTRPAGDSAAAHSGSSSASSSSRQTAEGPSASDAGRARSTFGGPMVASGHELFDPVERSGANEQAAVESTAKMSSTVDHVSGSHASGEPAPRDPVSAEHTPSDHTPSDHAPGDRAPVDFAPGDHAPVDFAPGDRAPVDFGSGDRAPVDFAPGDAGPVDYAAGNHAPVDYPSGNNAPVDFASSSHAPVEHAPADYASVDDGEPPEEPLDPPVARVVATLTDQVLVVDEQPRYHVSGCRGLIAQQTIPLPAREAVELGFTPCGWCTPDAVLGARHHAGARH